MPESTPILSEINPDADDNLFNLLNPFDMDDEIEVFRNEDTGLFSSENSLGIGQDDFFSLTSFEIQPHVNRSVQGGHNTNDDEAQADSLLDSYESQDIASICPADVPRHPTRSYFRNQSSGVFSIGERMLIHEHRNEQPRQVLERLRQRFLNSTHTVIQVSRAIRLARSKAEERGVRDEWAEGEMAFIKGHLSLSVKEMHRQLLTTFIGCSKTEFQVQKLRKELIGDKPGESRTCGKR